MPANLKRLIPARAAVVPGLQLERDWLKCRIFLEFALILRVGQPASRTGLSVWCRVGVRILTITNAVFLFVSRVLRSKLLQFGVEGGPAEPQHLCSLGLVAVGAL